MKAPWPTAAPAAGSHRIGRGIAQTLAALIAPLGIALITVPLLLRGYGDVRFGVLTLVWALIGYLGLFDLGIGRALTRELVHSRDMPVRRAEQIRTALTIVVVIGLAGALLFAACAPLLVGLLRIPVEFTQETVRTFRVAALAVPFATTTVVLRGVLEADGRFGAAALLRFPLAAAMLLAPLVALQFTPVLVPGVGAIVIFRAAVCIASAVVVFAAEPSIRGRFDRTVARTLVGFGGWVTLNMTLGPLMLTMDRFIVGAVVSAAAIAWYATPMEVVSRLWVIPGAVTTVLFPVLSSLAGSDRDGAAALMRRAALCLFLVLVPPALAGIVWAHELLTLWIGSDFADQSYRAAQLLLAGAVIAGLQGIPFALLQAGGRPDLPAKLNLIELPGYLLLAVVLTARYGVAGCAAAWLVRIAIDSALLIALADRRLSGALLAQSLQGLVVCTGGGLLALALALAVPSVPAKIGVMLTVSGICSVALVRAAASASGASLLRAATSRPAAP